MQRTSTSLPGLWSTEGLDVHVTVSRVAGRGDYAVTIDQAPISPAYRETTILSRDDLRSEFTKSNGLELEETERGMRLRRLKRAAISRVASEAGRKLFSLLFPENSAGYDLLGRCCELARARRERLRLLLELPEELAELPWETLVSPASGTYSRVLLQWKFSVVRCFHGSLEPRVPEKQGKDIVLLVMADPEDMGPVGLSKSFIREQRRLNEWFRQHGFHVEVIEGDDTRGQLEDSARGIAGDSPRSCGLHFIGHGGADQDGGYLVGVAQDSGAERIYWDDLQKVLEPLDFDWAIFNACETARAPVGAPLASIANSFSLIDEVPVVLAYLRPVETHAAEELAQDLYERVFAGRDSLDHVVQDMQKELENPGGLVLLRRFVRSSVSEVAHSTGTKPAPTNTTPAPTEAPLPVLPEMVEVPEGKLQRCLDERQIRSIIERFEQRPFAAFDRDELFNLLGRERDEVVLVHRFEIAGTPITRRQFGVFLHATGHQPSSARLADDHWNADSGPLLDLPMTHVSYRDALAFCEWARCRLPTGDEWKRAFRGSGRRLYPWGNTFDPAKCHGSEGNHGVGPLSVERFPEGRSSRGCFDLVGNVWEWTSDLGSAGKRLILGGSFNVTCEILGLPLDMRWALAQQWHADVGFRVARGANAEAPQHASE